jgi:hypothetical protein
MVLHGNGYGVIRLEPQRANLGSMVSKRCKHGVRKASLWY